EEVVPWFLDQMPAAYFQDTDHETRLLHLRAVIAGRTSGLPLSTTLRSEDGSSWTFIGERSYPGLLAQLLRQLPTDQPLRSAKVHSAADGRLVLDVFVLGEQARFDPEVPAQNDKRAALLEHAGRTRISSRWRLSTVTWP